MKALLLVAHGSRLETSNREVEQLVLAVGAQARFDRVECAFLELAEPDIPTGIGRCVEAGADSIVVVPYFLAAGTHVQHDIPAMVEEARERYPDCRFELTDHIGAAALMPELIRQMVE